jgi:hypothetical protein
MTTTDNRIEIRSTGRGFACCTRHLSLAVNFQRSRTVRVRPVAKDGRYKCECGRNATWYLLEVVPVTTP